MVETITVINTGKARGDGDTKPDIIKYLKEEGETWFWKIYPEVWEKEETPTNSN